MENYFDNLLPDSVDIRRRISSRFDAKSMSAFDLLMAEPAMLENHCSQEQITRSSPCTV